MYQCVYEDYKAYLQEHLVKAIILCRNVYSD